ncbi:MAG: OmpH family outer membrane protein [Bacteroidales bacterium]|jgi:outer membrane protein|nr:OmpH family outer membrane protein [Bacteroidales bacterium]MCU0407817.1 OmpH family outer membrane protein [Bacteroidales bacterium]
MKNLSIVLNVVLLVALGVLYILHFSGNKNGSKPATELSVGADGIAYINIDSVIFKFEKFTDMRNELLNKQKSAEAELNSKGNQYQKGVRDFQDKVNKGLITRATAAQMEQALLQEQQDLLKLQNDAQQNLMEEEQVMNRQILDYITSFLEANKEVYNCSYILGKSFGSVVLYGDSSLDITDKVVEAINLKYKSEKK